MTPEEIAVGQTPEEMADIICRQFGLETPMHLIRDAIATAITAKCAAERERCATMAEASIFGRHPELAAQMRRGSSALTNADQPNPSFECPGCGRTTHVIYNRSSCPFCVGED